LGRDFSTAIPLLFTILTELSSGILTLFVILDPIGVLPFFVLMTRGDSAVEIAKISRRAVLVAGGLLLIFAFLGDLILSFLGINIADFEIAGGALLLLFALRDALSNEPLGVTESNVVASKTTRVAETIAVVPIATPLLAGPGSLTTVILLARDPYGGIVSVVAIIVDCSIAWILFRVSGKITQHLGASNLLIIGKVMDILMAAIAVSYLTTGISTIFLR
jgi:multiple antibiotic resistance protein